MTGFFRRRRVHFRDPPGPTLRMKRLPFLAVLAFTLALALTIASAETPSESALALFRSKNYSAAREAFATLAAAEPQNADAHFHLGLIAAHLDDFNESIRQLEQAVALAPANPAYLVELGGAYGDAAEKAGLFEKLSWAKKCRAALEQAVQLAPDDIPARNALLTYYRQAPSFAGGGIAKAYEQAEEIRKRDPIAGAAALGQLSLADHKAGQAFALYLDALKSAPDNYAVLYGLGRAAAQTGQHLDEGEAALRRCLALPPPDDQPGPAPVQWRLGNIAEKRGDRAAARTAYEAAVKLDPSFKQAADSLAKLK